MGHYHIARLERGNGIVFDGKTLRVNLDAVGPDDHIVDDKDFVAKRHPDYYTYVSGGGSVLIDDRYLLVVRREPDARINPGLLSLFTGRANGPDEWAQPLKVVRELFEELVLCSEGRLLYPRCARLQPMIDSVYSAAGCKDTAVSFKLEEIPLITGSIEVTSGGVSAVPIPAFYHVNSRNDINVLRLFRTELDMNLLTARDGEHGMASGRTIAAIDLTTMTLKPLSDAPAQFEPVGISPAGMTEHLAAMLEMTTAYLQTNKAERRYQ